MNLRFIPEPKEESQTKDNQTGTFSEEVSG